VKSTHICTRNHGLPCLGERACIRVSRACRWLVVGVGLILCSHITSNIHFPVTPSPGCRVGSRRSQTVGLSRVGRTPTIPKKGTHIVKQTDSLQSSLARKKTTGKSFPWSLPRNLHAHLSGRQQPYPGFCCSSVQLTREVFEQR
jgi:hypothetical protein